MEWMDVPIVPISLPRELHADVKGRREFVMCVSNAARRGWSCSSLELSSSATTPAEAAAAVDMGGGATPSLASTQASRARTLSRTAMRGLSCSDILLLLAGPGWLGAERGCSGSKFKYLGVLTATIRGVLVLVGVSR